MLVKGSVREDKWLRTICTGCYGHCAIRVHRIDGVVVKVEGDPESVTGSVGGVCAKSSSMVQMLYHPKRFKYPMRRTNPKKGIGTDPGWKRISWDEALGEITERLEKIRGKKEGWRLCTVGGVGALPVTVPLLNQTGWRSLFGAYSGGAGHSVHCGQASHLGAGMNHCAWSTTPDFRYCWVNQGQPLIIMLSINEWLSPVLLTHKNGILWCQRVVRKNLLFFPHNCQLLNLGKAFVSQITTRTKQASSKKIHTHRLLAPPTNKWWYS